MNGSNESPDHNHGPNGNKTEEDERPIEEEEAVTSPLDEALAEKQTTTATSTTLSVPESSTLTLSDPNRRQQQPFVTMTEQQLVEALRSSASASASSSDLRRHAFWDTQPVPHGQRNQMPEGPIIPNRPPEEIRFDPYTLPAGFEWSNVNIQNESERLELYHLLANNYVEDDDASFRFDYSQDFLLWALTPPGFDPDFFFGVRSTAKQKLVAFISGVPARIQVYQQGRDMVEINFLCVHKKLRSKRLAPVLIKEITRRVNRTGVFQAVYTAGTVLPVPVSTARYYHRSLNPKKLVQVGFSRLGHRMTMARMQKLYKLPEQTSTPGLRPMTGQDVDGVHALLTTYLRKFSLKTLFTRDDVAHWLVPRPRVIDTFVVESREHPGTMTDFISFYHLPSSILHHNDTLYAAYSYYNIATSVPLTDLMKDALILAKRAGADVFNALTLMDNTTFLEELKFGMGDGILRYYIFNWACPEMPSNQVGIVLL